MTESRKKYLEFLKQQVQKHCNDNGCYQVHWDYHYQIHPYDFLRVYKQFGFRKSYQNHFGIKTLSATLK